MKGCAGDQQQWRARWEAVAAELGADLSTTTAPGDDGDEEVAPADFFGAREHLLSGGVPPLSSITSPQDFHLALRALRARAGNPSLRDLSVSARKHGDRVLPRSTLAGALARTDRLPSMEIVEAFLSACDVQATEVEAVKSAWTWVAYILQRDSIPGSAGWQSSCPYLGLAAFTEDQAEVFHGREHLTAQLVKELAKRVRGGAGMLVVTGPSGAGKSSLLRAGLLPALAKGPLGPGSQDWPRLVITPGPAPLEALAVPLAQLAGVNSAEVRKSLAAHPDTAHLNVRQALLTCAAEQAGAEPRVAPSRLVLIVDRFEELFTVVSDKAERAAFITSLCAMAGVGRGTTELPPAIVVLGLRADFFNHCTAYAPLVEVLSRMFVVRPMTEVELRSAITGPAAAAGLSIEAGLVDNILAELRSTSTADRFDPGALPLLSQAMLLAWDHREGTTITRHAYAIGGGIHNGIQKSADEVYENLTPEQQEAARILFRRMVTFTSQGQPTRCAVQLNDLSTDDAARAALEEFTSKRLITLRRDAAEIVHEVLVHTWKRLGDWIDEDRERLRLHRELESAASVWEANEQDPAFLYRGSRLAAVQENLDEINFLVPPRAQSFLDSSRNHERRRTRKLRGLRKLVGLLAVVAIFAGCCIFWQYRSLGVTAAKLGVTAAEETAVNSQFLMAKHPDNATLLALKAFRQKDTPVTRGALLSAQSQYFDGQLDAKLPINTGVINKVVFSPNGRLLATASEDGTMELWDVASRRVVGTFHTGGLVNDAEFSPDGRLLVTAGAKGVVLLWNVASQQLNVASQKPIGTLSDGPSAVPPDVTLTTAKFSTDGSALVAVDTKGILRLWDVASRQSITPFGSSSRITNAVFSRGSNTLATSDDKGILQLWNVADLHHPIPLGSPLNLTDQTMTVNAVVFSPDGSTLATAGTDGTARLWNVSDPIRPSHPIALSDQDTIINDVVFSSDGGTLVTAGTDGTAQLWDVVTHHLIGTLTGHTGSIHSAAFRPNGHIVATAGNDRVVRLWDTAGPILSPPVIGSDVHDMEFSPGRRILATVGGQGVVGLWDIFGRFPIETLKGYAANAVAFGRNRRLLAIAGAGKLNSTQLWDMVDRRPIATLPATPGFLSSKIIFSPNDQILAITSEDDESHTIVQLWNVADPSHPEPYDSFPTGYDVVFSGDGRFLAIAGRDGFIQLWNIVSRHPIATLPGTPGFASKVVFGQDGLVTVDKKGTVQWWEAATGRPVAAIEITIPEDFYPLVLSPDGRVLVIASSDGAIKLLSIDHNGEPISTLTGHTGFINAAAFSRDSSFLATASYDGTVRLWDLSTERVIDHLSFIVASVRKKQ